MERERKEELVASLKQVFEESNSVVVTHYTGLSVAEIEQLRSKMRIAGANFRITKNRLTRLALVGTSFEELSSLFIGPTAIAYSGDPVAAAKVVVNFANENDKLVVLGGAFSGQMLDLEGVRQLALLPSLDELRAKLVGLINAPATKVARILNVPGTQVARVVSAFGKK